MTIATTIQTETCESAVRNAVRAIASRQTTLDALNSGARTADEVATYAIDEGRHVDADLANYLLIELDESGLIGLHAAATGAASCDHLDARTSRAAKSVAEVVEALLEGGAA